VRHTCLVDRERMKMIIASIGTEGFRMIVTAIDAAKTTLQRMGKGWMQS